MGCSSLGGGVGSAGPRGDPNRGLLGRRGGGLAALTRSSGLGSGKNQGKSRGLDQEKIRGNPNENRGGSPERAPASPKIKIGGARSGPLF